MQAGIMIINYTFTKTKPIQGKNDYENKENPFEGADGREYVTYRNYKYAERFDHIGITLNSDHARHDAIYYLNGLDPMKTVEKQKTVKPIRRTKILLILVPVQVAF